MSFLSEFEDQREVYREGDYEFKQTFGGVEITGFHGRASMSEPFVVPNALGGEDVVAIGKNGLSQLSCKTIVLPEPLRSIESGAVSSNPFLKTVVIPANVDDVEYGAFANCDRLENLEISRDNDAYKFRKGALYSLGREPSLVFVPQGRKLVDLVVPNGIKKIDARAVAYNGCLQRVFLPSSVDEVDNCAFMGCQSLNQFVVSRGNFHYRAVKGALFQRFASVLCRYPAARNRRTVVVPESVCEIEGGAFSANFYIERVEIPSTIYSIEDSTFYYCTALECVLLPETLRNIETYAFGYCTALREIKLPDSVSNIEDYAFWHSGLESVKLSENLVSIGAGAFEGCSKLKTIAIPESVEFIGENAFPCETTLRVAPGGRAEEWARENKRKIC